MKTRTTALQISGAILLGVTGVAATAQTPEPGAGYVNEDEDEFPWGLLGLLGLAGLLGMKRDDRQASRNDIGSPARWKTVTVDLPRGRPPSIESQAVCNMPLKRSYATDLRPIIWASVMESTFLLPPVRLERRHAL
jgi:hypothetical protein